MKDFSRYWDALTYSFLKYKDRFRKSNVDIPYVIHPIRITLILRAAGFNEFDHEELMVAALLHDLVEDTEMTIEEIEKKFGEKIASIVAELTKPLNGSKERWLKRFTSSSKEAKIIKMADRIDNLIDMGAFFSEKTQKSYARQGKIILKTCGAAHEGLAQELNNIIMGILSE
ncbi:MAG: HD domain-containing protein [Promethearchaeota archaeon]